LQQIESEAMTQTAMTASTD